MNRFENETVQPVASQRLNVGAIALALGSAGVVVTSVLYGMSAAEVASPFVESDMDSAVAGAIQSSGTMYAAGLVGITSNLAFTVGALVLGVQWLQRGAQVQSVGWFILAFCTIIFTIVDALVGFVLPPMAQATGVTSGFAMAKHLFDILFLWGTTTFGVGIVLAVAGDQFDRCAIPRVLAIPVLLIGVAAFLSGGAGLFGVHVNRIGGLTILFGSAFMTLIGLYLARPQVR